MVDKKPDELLQEVHFQTISEIIQQAQAAEVMQIVNVGTSVAESMNSVAIAQRFDSVYASVGVHPCDTTDSWRDDMQAIKKMIVADQEQEQRRIVALGETGLDFYHQPFIQSRQEDVFKAHIELALTFKLPLVVHVREAGDELLKVLEEYVRDGVRGVIHCFSQKQDFAEVVTSWGLSVGIDGPITYPKNQILRDCVASIDPKYIILETDAPFLPPQSYRGKKNSPAYIPLFAPTVAECVGLTLESLAMITTHNAQRLFDLGTQQ